MILFSSAINFTTINNDPVKKSVNWHRIEYLCLLLILFSVNAMYWNSALIPTHDSLQNYHIFHYFYCSIWFHGVVPEWMPYSTFGLPSSMYHCCGLTPAQYLAGLSGLLFKIIDTMFLFKLSVLIEQCIFITGIYWLCRLYYRDFSTRLIVYTACIFGLDWWTQIWWNFRIYEYWPLLLASTLTFFQTRNSAYFWLTMVLGITSLHGSLPYYLPVYFLFGLTYAIVLTCQYGFPWRTLIKLNAVNMVGLCIVLLFCGLYLSVALKMMHGLIPGSITGRDPETMKVTLESFLTHAGNYDLAWMFKNFLLGYPVRIGNDRGFAPDLTVYIGIVPVIFSIYGLSFIRNKEFGGLAITAMVILWFICGGLFALLSYYLIPAMTSYRYISFLWPFFKIYLVFIGAYSVERIVAERDIKHLYWLLGIIVFTTDGLFNSYMLATGWNEINFNAYATIVKIKFVVLIAVLLVAIVINISTYIKQKVGTSPHAFSFLKYGITTFCVIDMLLFNTMIGNEVVNLNCNSEATQQLFSVSKMEYHDQRTVEPPTDSVRAKFAHQLMLNIAKTGQSQINQVTYNYLQYDPAGSEFFVPILTKPIKELLFSRANSPHLYQLKNSNEQDRTLLNIVDPLFACNYPKLHLSQNSVEANDLSSSISLVNKIKDFDKEVVIIRNKNSIIPEGRPMGINYDIKTTKYEVISFTPNRLKIKLINPPDYAWLVYADSYDENWSCYINDQSVELSQANAAFKAVAVNKETKYVEFIYQESLWSAPCFRLMLLAILQIIALITLPFYFHNYVRKVI